MDLGKVTMSSFHKWLSGVSEEKLLDILHTAATRQINQSKYANMMPDDREPFYTERPHPHAEWSMPIYKFILAANDRNPLNKFIHGITESKMQRHLTYLENVIDDQPVTIKKQSVSDDYGLAWTIFYGGKRAGWIGGYESVDWFMVRQTEISPEYRGKGIYQKAIQQVANLFKGGVKSDLFQTSSMLKKALLKMPTAHIDTDKEAIIISPEKQAEGK